LRRADEMGITAVPTYVIDGRWSIPGAQDAAVFEQVFRRLAARRAESASA
jgi:predicted DsbA family dithiol-disulfide isomerase